MARAGLRFLATVLFVTFAIFTLAQQTPDIQTNAVVPPLVNFSGGLIGANAKPVGGLVGVTFSLYKDSEGGAPLWIETQNVQADKAGHYSVMLGSTSSRGLPSELFASGEARWLGVQPQGQAEQPRVLLMSVPYALKALDAQTLGGRPASAFLAASGASGSTPAGNVTGSGTKNFIPRWTSTTQIGNSNIFENASGQVGIATSTPTAKLDVNGATDIRNTLTLFPNGGNAAVKVSGTAFAVNNAGKVTFISGQTFPGTGTITGVTAGSGLVGGGTSGSVKLSMTNTCSSGQILQWNGTKWVCSNAATGTITGVTAQAPITGGGSSGSVNIGLTKSCSSGQVLQWNGSTWACSTVGSGTITGVTAGTDLTGGGTSGNVTLNLDITKVPQLTAANSFTNNNAITGAGTGFALMVTQPPAINGQAGTPALQSVGGDADFNGQQAGGVGVTAQGGGGGSANISGAGGNAINAFGGSAGNGNGGVGVSTLGGFGTGGDLVETGSGGAAVVATGGDSEFFFGGDGIDATGGAGGQGNNFASSSGNGVVGTGGQGGFEEADGSGGFFTGGTAGGFGGFGIEVIAGSDLAGFFEGDVTVTGAISAGAKDFKIDHPLDPANKYLSHASIESSEMINIYTGNTTTDAQGDAQVQLPDWFEAVNTDFRYQLTVIGQFAQAIVSSRVSNHQFAIKTDKPNVDVSWQIAGVRQDAFAKAHPLVVEQDKNARERGFYLHPELYGAPVDKGIAWSHHPDTMRRVKSMQQRPKETAPRPRRRAAPSAHATVATAKAR
jgi:trimeric autotransporter adhesin